MEEKEGPCPERPGRGMNGGRAAGLTRRGWDALRKIPARPLPYPPLFLVHIKGLSFVMSQEELSWRIPPPCGILSRCSSGRRGPTTGPPRRARRPPGGGREGGRGNALRARRGRRRSRGRRGHG